ncbi:unnamed protein product (macronuclear) [Paramecium tetraurelia]|uniref:Uncharacterized protein n=1 Tax=Paramecium tetraurelia TaxID=5888 RepID=A0D5E2_PARTE|nr:uncharacterized protein GSPATT00013708001 [Paramecium tetraurelia]CAK78259.1 unnamed protein product [Paramecium tetraurelia]|eukprot:XP_001445656.1 hypothetical protein (macronuclear) [Paramecium tetraurelia strain d4-2]
MSFDNQKQKKTQDNKITMVNEMVFLNLTGQSPIKAAPLLKKQKSRKLYKRAATIIDDDDSYKGPFEDSRVTRMIFEKYRMVELTRFWFIIACMVLTILELFNIPYQDNGI